VATCPSCDARKGKRSCPALGGLICPRCCGTKRILEIRCPPDCRYLSHERYQGKRLLTQASPLQKRYLEASGKGEDFFQMLILVDMHLADFLRANPDFPLPAVRQAVAYLRRLASPLETVEGTASTLEMWFRDKVGPLLDKRMVNRDHLGEAAEATLAFFEENLRGEEDLRSYLRFVDAFVGDSPRPEVPEEDRGPDSDPGRLIVPGR